MGNDREAQKHEKGWGETVEVYGKLLSVFHATEEPETEPVLVMEEGYWVEAVLSPDLVEEWDSYTLDAGSIESGEFGGVYDRDSNLVGVACPGCGDVLLLENAQEQDHAWGRVWNTFLVCHQCHTLVSVTVDAKKSLGMAETDAEATGGS